MVDMNNVATQNYRSNVLRFEEKMSNVPGVKFGDLENCPLTHEFCDGLYVRTIFMPKGMLIVSKIHKHTHPAFILSGKVSVLDEKGIKFVEGPCKFITPAGTKRVLYTHEDTVWTTVHATKETELTRIEEEVIAKTFDEVDEIGIDKMIKHISGGAI